MGKTYKDRKVAKIEEKGYTPKILKEEYRREKVSVREIDYDIDNQSEE